MVDRAGAEVHLFFSAIGIILKADEVESVTNILLGRLIKTFAHIYE